MRGAFVILVVLSVGSSVSVTATINLWDPGIVALMALIAALSSSCLTGLGITQKSKDMMNARRQLEGAIANYEEHLISKKRLHEILQQAAILIGDVRYVEPETDAGLIAPDESVVNDE